MCIKLNLMSLHCRKVPSVTRYWRQVAKVYRNRRTGWPWMCVCACAQQTFFSSHHAGSCSFPGSGHSGRGAASGPWSPLHWIPATALPPHLHHALHRAQCSRAHSGGHQLPSAGCLLVSWDHWVFWLVFVALAWTRIREGGSCLNWKLAEILGVKFGLKTENKISFSGPIHNHGVRGNGVAERWRCWTPQGDVMGLNPILGSNHFRLLLRVGVEELVSSPCVCCRCRHTEELAAAEKCPGKNYINFGNWLVPSSKQLLPCRNWINGQGVGSSNLFLHCRNWTL